MPAAPRSCRTRTADRRPASLALVGLTQLDWVTVHWEAISSAFDRFVANVEREAGSFQTLVTGSLPQAGLAGLGLFAGLRR
ncbi:MAG: hypothetical protein HZB39_04345 [Planctomycetes bacterium]|nr:hypothetical protein [Planctomycetota bacterium]